MAVDITAKSKGTINVLNVIPIATIYDPNFIGGSGAYTQQFLNSMEEDVKKAFTEMRKSYGKGQEVNLEITVGGLFESINRVTEEEQIDLIVMGTSGASGFQEALIGSNTEKAVRFSKVPVLAVHQATNIDSIKNILVPTTGNLDQSDFISKIKNLQDFLKAKFHILLINTPNNFKRDAEGREILMEFVKNYHLDNYELHFKNYRDEEEGIIDFATSHNMDLIAMATHSRKGIAHLFSGSITEKVVNHIPSPVWTYSIRK
jgi:nucleotide-binding universal stress UspA family protein